MALTIRVRETASKYVPAERADLQLGVCAQGPDKREAAGRARTVLEFVTAELAELEQAGTVRRWSSDQLTTHSYQRWGDEGDRSTAVHQVTAKVRIRFDDLQQVARAVERWSEVEDLSVEQLKWELTSTTRDSVVGDLRKQVVQAAAVKAQQYAQAAGFDTIRAVSLSDVDRRDPNEVGGFEAQVMSRSARGEEPHLSLTPSDINISITIDGEFETD